MKKSIKKLAVIVIVLTLFAMLFSCGNKEQTGTNKGNSKIEFTPEYAQKVLDREIFVAKKEFLNIYNSQINGIDKLISYKENWTFRKILNTENFVGIKWSISYPGEGGEVITFSGKIASANAIVSLDFFTNEGSKIHLLERITITEGEKTTVVSMLDFEQSSLSEDQALICTDILISCTITKFCNNAMVLATVYYEKLADEYLQKADYDNAILYYQKAKVKNDNLFSAYYAKAEQFLIKEDFDNARHYFALAENYRDSAVRALEIYYKVAQKHEQNGDYEKAATNYLAAGNYLDAKQKCKECNYLFGEESLTNKDYKKALLAFLLAGDYSDSSDKYKEACYLYAEQQLLLGEIFEAESYFKEAEDYKDASTRMKQYYYDLAVEYLNSKNYLSAAEIFNMIIEYSDSTTKYKEANYLYGESLLEKGNPEDAKLYFQNAQGYKDATTRVQRYFYELGESFVKKGDYVSASQQFISAGKYSDAETMALECYYLYGKKQLELNYITSAIEYLEKCGNYKDASKIIKEYYYAEAEKATEKLISSFSESYASVTHDLYDEAVEKLELCDGYKDSSTVLAIIKKIYYVWEEFQYKSKFTASLYGMSVRYTTEYIEIQQTQFVSHTDSVLELEYDIKNNSFNATISDITFIGLDRAKVIGAMVELFTGITDINDLKTKLSSSDSWRSENNNFHFSHSYGGYKISVDAVESQKYGKHDVIISATK